MTQYVVAMRTHGSFADFCTDPMDLDGCQAFLDDPPDIWRPRPQDDLVIYELHEIRVHER